MRYPKIQSENIVETIHGVEVADLYRLMEDEKNPEVLRWVDEENAVTDEWLKDSQVEVVKKQLLEDMDYYRRGLPSHRGDYYFWSERQPGQAHSVLYRGSGIFSDDKEVVFDVNQLSEDGSVSLSFFRNSRKARYVVYGLSEKGTERNKIYIRDNKTNNDEEFYFGRSFGMDWLDDEAGFCYTRSNYQDHGNLVEDETHYQQVYFHRLGDKRADDELLFDAVDFGLPKESGLRAHFSENNEWMAVEVSLGWSKNRIFLASRSTMDFTEIFPEFDGIKMLYLLEGYAYVTTNYQADRFCVLRTGLAEVDQPREKWHTFIAEDEHRVLENWHPTLGEILVEYSQDTASNVDIFDRQGVFLRSLDLPVLATLMGLWSSQYSHEYYFSVQTYLTPSVYYLGDNDGRYEEIWRDDRSLSDDVYEAKQIWYASKDGTKVPMSLVGRRDALAACSPALLYAYGGFAHSAHPTFIDHYLPWLKAGGILAFPAIRGGGEYGESWHQAGMLANKQNSFDDMIAAAEYLVDQKLTESSKLAIMGGSNGGLLIGACIAQRPELFGVAVSLVPLLDMVRFPKFLLAHRWVHEYGDPAKPEEFTWLINYSPYHHISEKTTYPPALFIAGMNDSRVHPMHAWKMTALMQSLPNAELVLLRTRMKSGHGQGRGVQQWIGDFAEQLAFIGKVLGVDMEG